MGGSIPLVLCVEDDPDTQEMLGILLKERGYECKAVGSCADALQEISKDRLALVLLDNSLPDGSGIDLCRQVRGFNKDLPIIFLSGLSDEDARRDALACGANAFITKPLSLVELYRVLSEHAPLLERSENRR